MDFSAKVAIVTGAGKGIGRGVSLALAARGAKVVLAGKRDESINAVKAEIEKTGGEAYPVRTDVAKWQDAEGMVRAAMDRYGRIDILVNNAGVDKQDKGGKQYSILDMEDEDWDYVLGVNLKGQVHCAKAVMPIMMAQKKGNIVSIASTVGFGGQIGSPPYCASKAAIMVFNKMLARELGPHGVYVNCVAPQKGRAAGRRGPGGPLVLRGPHVHHGSDPRRRRRRHYALEGKAPIRDRLSLLKGAPSLPFWPARPMWAASSRILCRQQTGCIERERARPWADRPCPR